MSNSRSRGFACGAVSVLLSVAGLVPGAWGQLQEGDALTPVIAGLPLSTAVVAVSSHPSAVLQSLGGPWRRMGPIATGVASEPLKSWAAVARELGYKPDEAFNELTSGGLAVVIAESAFKGVGAAGNGTAAPVEPHWAVLSVVKARVAARVREKLKAAPHEVIAGVPVLSVEDGQFALVCRGLTGVEGGDEVLALASMDDRAFLESIVAAVEAARPRTAKGEVKVADGTLGGTGAFTRAKRTLADVLILARESGGPEQGWGEASVVACTLGEQAWTFDAVSAGGQGATAKAQPLPPEALALFDAWGPSAGVMVVGSGLDGLTRGFASSIPPGMDAPQVNFLKGVEAACLFLGPSAANVKNGTLGGGVSAWGAVRVKDRASLPVSVVDSLGPGVVVGVEHGWSGLEEHAAMKGKGGAVIDPGTFAAMPEFALRVVSVKLADGGPLAGAVGGSPLVPGSVAWFVCPAPGSSGGENEARWAAMGVEPRGDADAVSARHKGMTGVLAGAPVAKPSERAWLWRGVVRPGVLVDSFPSSMRMAIGFSGIGTVKEVRFESWDEEGTDPGVRTRVVVEWK